LIAQSTMALRGPHALNRAAISRMVTRRSPGVYVLSRDGRTAHYVGRSDLDLQGRLLNHIGSRYIVFWYAFSTSVIAAYYQECTLYHRFGGSSKLDNKVHP